MSSFLKTTHALLLCGLFSMCSLEARWDNIGDASPLHSEVTNGMDGSGNATAVWVESSARPNHIYSSNLFHGENEYWRGADPIFGDYRLFGSPHIAIDSSWNSVVVWQEYDGSLTKVRASTRPFKGKWSEPVDLSAATMNRDLVPQVAISPSGYAVAIWCIDTVVQAATMQFGEHWSAPVDLANQSSAPKIKVDGGGNAVAVWQKEGKILSASLPYGGSWSKIFPISNKKSGNDPQLALNLPGFAVVTWIDYGQIYSIHAATMQFGEAWSKPTLLGSADGIQSHAVAIDAEGRAIALWTQFDLDDTQAYPIPTPASLQSASFSTGYWSRPIPISASEESAFNPAITFDGTGRAYVVWNTYSKILASQLPLNTHIWTSPEVIRSGQFGLLSKPQISADLTGSAVVNWSNELGVIQSAKWVAEEEMSK